MVVLLDGSTAGWMVVVLLLLLVPQFMHENFEPCYVGVGYFDLQDSKKVLQILEIKISQVDVAILLIN